VALLLQSSSLHSTSRSSCRHHHSPSSQRDGRGHGSRRKIQELQIPHPHPLLFSPVSPSSLSSRC
jgi:hypothetical protein